MACGFTETKRKMVNSWPWKWDNDPNRLIIPCICWLHHPSADSLCCLPWFHIRVCVSLLQGTGGVSYMPGWISGTRSLKLGSSSTDGKVTANPLSLKGKQGRVYRCVKNTLLRVIPTLTLICHSFWHIIWKFKYIIYLYHQTTIKFWSFWFSARFRK